ncbi:hypothetical protein WQ57_00440 [Mesobacillus campisalis]|uniref:Sodium:pantothenate symporter n=1 Tax=Mesobacillus campisalis TaxID=1408103 RepID=A0A0M2T3F0_9BACI|nr:hypothetical protein [Mesobacillus campisalis]KKK39802.1 hypothetical protein WQ57_00440 [Mesobacillus campisalis]
MNKDVKEPIQKKWIWIGLVIILLGNVPWYFSDSMVEPYIFGFPLWGFIILIFSVILSAYLSWICLTQWNLVEDEEEANK